MQQKFLFASWVISSVKGKHLWKLWLHTAHKYMHNDTLQQKTQWPVKMNCSLKNPYNIPTRTCTLSAGQDIDYSIFISYYNNNIHSMIQRDTMYFFFQYDAGCFKYIFTCTYCSHMQTTWLWSICAVFLNWHWLPLNYRPYGF